MRNAPCTMVMMRTLGEIATETYAVALRNHLAELAVSDSEKAHWVPSAPAPVPVVRGGR